MHKRYTILFSLLFAPTLQAADPYALQHGTHSPDSTDVRSIMNLYTQIAGVFNVDHSIENGINAQELELLNQRLDGTNNTLSAYHNDPEFNQQVLEPLRGTHQTLQKNIAYLHCLHSALRVVRTNDDSATMCSNLHEELSGLTDEQNGRLAQGFAPFIFKQLLADSKGDDFITMGGLLRACDDNKYAAVVYGLKHQDSEYRNLIGRLIFAQKAPIETQLLNTMQADIDAPDGLLFHQNRLGGIVTKIQKKQKSDSSVYPEKWVAGVSSTAWGILGQEGNEIYADFQNIFDLELNNTVPKQLETILSEHNYTTHKSIKNFLSRLERYKYQLESRPSANFSLGLTKFTDSARYDDHKKITTKLIGHLNQLYPGIVTELDEQIMLHGQQDSYDLMVKMQAQGYEAIISGIRNELKEITRKSVQEENPDFTVL